MRRFGWSLLGGLLWPGLAVAQDASPPSVESGATAWLLTSCALVLMMTLPGLVLFYGGLVRRKNVLAIAGQCLAAAAIASVLWHVVGYSLAFSGVGPFVGDLGKALFAGVSLDAASGVWLGGAADGAFGLAVPEFAFAMFQLTFAAITPAIIVGSVADRMKFSAFVLFVALWTVLVYAPVAHWVWHPAGFLFTLGALDFAGGTVVHVNAGVAGLVAALFLGKRKAHEPHTPHNLVLTVMGAALLWVGWFGFNAGSAIEADGQAALAMYNTQVAAAAGALAWMLLEWLLLKKPSVLGLVTGAVAGLVAITPAAGLVEPSASLPIGAAGSLGAYLAVAYLKPALKYDDALDAFGVHGAAGLVGAGLTGWFAAEAVGGYAGSLGQVLIQLQAVGITALYSALATALILLLLRFTIGLRVSQEVEYEGLDYALHGESVP